jgi:hypothetical protein
VSRSGLAVPQFSPDAEETVRRLADQGAAAIRNAFAIGAQHGNHAFAPASRPTNLVEWRRAGLLRYADPSWKRSIVMLVPASRFRPSDIYTARRAELAALHPENRSLNVGTHNALDGLIADRVIAKLGEGLYAPAVDGVPLPQNADEPCLSYEPATAFDEHAARLLGYTLWVWALLEWNVIYLTDVLRPGAVADAHEKPREAVADELARAIAEVHGRLAPEHADRLSALVSAFAEHVARHRALIFARPAGVDGASALTSKDPEIIWGPHTLMATAQAFEKASDEANRLLNDPLLAASLAQPSGSESGPDLSGFADPEIRVVAATARLALLASLSPLIALSGIRAMHGLNAYASALENSGILRHDETRVIVPLLHAVERASFGTDVDDLWARQGEVRDIWRLATSPGKLQRAIMLRAQYAGEAPRELPAPLPGAQESHVPLVEVRGVTVAVPRSKDYRPGANEVVIDLAKQYALSSTSAIVRPHGSRTMGNAAAYELVPWLVDELVEDSPGVAAITHPTRRADEATVTSRAQRTTT